MGTEKTMLSENGDVINVNTTRCQTTQLLVFKIARRLNHYGFSLDRRCNVHGREQNDTKTVNVDAIFLKTEHQALSVEINQPITLVHWLSNWTGFGFTTQLKITQY